MLPRLAFGVLIPHSLHRQRSRLNTSSGSMAWCLRPRTLARLLDFALRFLRFADSVFRAVFAAHFAQYFFGLHTPGVIPAPQSEHLQAERRLALRATISALLFATAAALITRPRLIGATRLAARIAAIFLMGSQGSEASASFRSAFFRFRSATSHAREQ